MVPIQVAPGYQLMVEFAADERIESVAVGDSGAWQVTPNHSGDRLFIKPLQALATNLTVVTSARTYTFDLAPARPRDLMCCASPIPARTRPPRPIRAGAVEGRYRLSGARALRPSRISDDGRPHLYRMAARPLDPGGLRGRRARAGIDRQRDDARRSVRHRRGRPAAGLPHRPRHRPRRARRGKGPSLMARRKTGTDPRTAPPQPGEETAEASVKPVVRFPAAALRPCSSSSPSRSRRCCCSACSMPGGARSARRRRGNAPRTGSPWPPRRRLFTFRRPRRRLR